MVRTRVLLASIFSVLCQARPLSRRYMTKPSVSGMIQTHHQTMMKTGLTISI
ncbi:hypothetical protein D3C79_1072690 [compost metagenome]